jgi:hypothetical protein
MRYKTLKIGISFSMTLYIEGAERLNILTIL